MGLLAAVGTIKKVQFIKSGSAVISFEASLKETHARKSTPTKFPIEDGSYVNDHIILDPLELNMTLIITDYPISSLSGLLTEAVSSLTSKLIPKGGLISAGGGLGGLSAISALFGKSSSPSITAYQQLLKIQESKSYFSVLTSLYRYENMCISSLSVPRESANGKCILVDLTLTQLIIVQPKVVQIKALANPGIADALRDTGKNASSGLNGFSDGVKYAVTKVLPAGVVP
jgi:hypothetical protein